MTHESSPPPPGASGRTTAPDDPSITETAMYDMYPDWGPASHNPDNPRSLEATTAAVQASLDLRDDGGRVLEDN